MSCSKVRKVLAQYMDETLPISVEERVRQHLGGCGGCAALAEEIRRTVTLVQALPRLETSPDFMANFRRHLPVAVALSRRPSAPAGIVERLSQRWNRRLTRRFSIALAPVALAIALGLFLWHSKGGLQQAVAPVHPVITEREYLATLAQEHAGYAREHPLIDSSSANLVMARAKTHE